MDIANIYRQKRIKCILFRKETPVEAFDSGACIQLLVLNLWIIQI
jgi:hypothetical protein